MYETRPFRPGPPPGAPGDAADREYQAWLTRAIAAGCDPDEALVPDDDDVGGPAAASAARPSFGQGGDADALPPGTLLSALTEQAAGELGRLSDDELVGTLLATQRQIAREQYKQVLLTAEFGRRRRDAFAAAARRGVPAGCRPGGFPGEELAAEMVITRVEAGHRIDDALDLTARLPRTLAGMAAGQIDAGRAGWIAFYTRSLTPADAAAADEILAAAAPELRTEQLARKAAALETKLNPAGVAARKEHARREHQRVETRRESSGNASLAGRELGSADVLAAKAHIDAIATRLRESGLFDGTLDRLRALAFTDLTQGRNPLDRIAAAERAGAERAGAERAGADDRGSRAAPTGGAASRGHADGRGYAAGPAPLPALINLIVPAGTLLGWSAAPAEAGSWGLLDRDETGAVAAAAAADPRTRWCVTLTAPDGTAVAHGCARGPRPRLLDGLEPQPPPQQLADQKPQPPPRQLADLERRPAPQKLADQEPQPSPRQLAELIRRLDVTFTSVTRGPCAHVHADARYSPGRSLRHLVRARSATCDAPGCPAQALSADLDHTVPWPAGPTCPCNLAPRCRTHHRAKQAPDWTVEQTAPGVARWTMPSGRVHTTGPTKYQL